MTLVGHQKIMLVRAIWERARKTSIMIVSENMSNFFYNCIICISSNNILLFFPMKLIYHDLVNLGKVVWANTAKSFLNIISTTKRSAIIKERKPVKWHNVQGWLLCEHGVRSGVYNRLHWGPAIIVVNCIKVLIILSYPVWSWSPFLLLPVTFNVTESCGQELLHWRHALREEGNC